MPGPATEASFHLAGWRDLWRASWVTALAFGLPTASKSLRRAIAGLRFPWDLLRLAGATAGKHLYTNGPNEFVLIDQLRLNLWSVAVQAVPVVPLGAVAVVGASRGSLPVACGALAAIVLYQLWIIVMAAIVALPRDRRNAMKGQRRLLREFGGSSIMNAAQAPTGDAREPRLGYGTLGRIAAFVESRPDLQPCSAVAMTPRYFKAYSRYMEPVGTSGLLFTSQRSEPDDDHGQPSYRGDRGGCGPAPVQAEELPLR